jgi:hypothetical protein
MICVEECVGDDLPSNTPRKFLVIDEDPHEFWYGEGWVCLDSHHVRNIDGHEKEKITSFNWIATSIGVD